MVRNQHRGEALRARLRAALSEAMKRRDAIATSALRSALAAIDNAEAVGLTHAPAPSPSGTIAGAIGGLCAAEVPRRELGGDELAAILDAEINQRRVAADDYARRGAHDRAARLRAEADALAAAR